MLALRGGWLRARAEVLPTPRGEQPCVVYTTERREPHPEESVKWLSAFGGFVGEDNYGFRLMFRGTRCAAEHTVRADLNVGVEDVSVWNETAFRLTITAGHMRCPDLTAAGALPAARYLGHTSSASFVKKTVWSWTQSPIESRPTIQQSPQKGWARTSWMRKPNRFTTRSTEPARTQPRR